MGMAGAPQLDGRVAIVTGGSRGIGLAIASMLLSRGAAVAISGVNESNLESARRQLAREAGADAAARVAAVQADVRDPQQVAALVSGVVARFGRLDLLVNNAGVGSFAEVAGQDPDDWRRTIDTNLTGVFYCCHEAIPHLRRAGGGWIVNISSLAGKNPFAGGAAYCASKAGLNAFSEALMQEVRYDNIRVSYVLPGSVDTGFSGHATPADWKLSPEDVAAVVSDLISHHPRSLPSRVELRPSKPRK
jgi:NAD(P)-dependent dehydrogenase (short-subunit alcohol dehydrogenase family)